MREHVGAGRGLSLSRRQRPLLAVKAGLGVSLQISDKRSRGKVMAKTLLALVTHSSPHQAPVGDKHVKSPKSVFAIT